jgi:Trk K+ transport system NAD-binding subunit
VARDLLGRGLEYRIIERTAERIRDKARYVLGDAAELSVLEKAGIMETGTIVISTHDDDTNIYLTIYCRRLRPNVRIVSRATLERNVATLHRAGADFVMSYASLGANAILTLLDRSDVLMVAEGLDVFRVPMPATLVGRTLAEADIRQKTGCTVVAWQIDDEMTLNPDPHLPMPARSELILIGAVTAERAFLQRYEVYGKAPTQSYQNPFHEPFLLFSFMAALTTTIEFVTGVLILPQRETALVAKQAAELDVLSNGRFRLGIGNGWNKVEYQAQNQDFRLGGANASKNRYVRGCACSGKTNWSATRGSGTPSRTPVSTRCPCSAPFPSGLAATPTRCWNGWRAWATAGSPTIAPPPAPSRRWKNWKTTWRKTAVPRDIGIEPRLFL